MLSGFFNNVKRTFLADLIDHRIQINLFGPNGFEWIFNQQCQIISSLMTI